MLFFNLSVSRVPKWDTIAHTESENGSHPWTRPIDWPIAFKSMSCQLILMVQYGSISNPFG